MSTFKAYRLYPSQFSATKRDDAAAWLNTASAWALRLRTDDNLTGYERQQAKNAMRACLIYAEAARSLAARYGHHLP